MKYKRGFLERLFNFCIHDWETLSWEYVDEIERQVKNFRNIFGAMKEFGSNRPSASKKICLKCGKYVDNIKRLEEIFKKEVVEKEKKEKERSERASNLLNKLEI